MKLSLDALKERAEATASTELMETISGGTENACHDSAVHNAAMANAQSSNMLYNSVVSLWNWITN